MQVKTRITTYSSTKNEPIILDAEDTNGSKKVWVGIDGRMIVLTNKEMALKLYNAADEALKFFETTPS